MDTSASCLKKSARRALRALTGILLAMAGAQGQAAEPTPSRDNPAESEAELPVNFMVSQVLKVGKLPLSLQLGYRYYADGPSGGPDWGLRFTVTFLFPKH
jgi:hypothetical protein